MISIYIKKILIILFVLIANNTSAKNQTQLQIKQASAPKIIKNKILFTFKFKNAKKVYLAGNFNNWAENNGGKITNPKFEMIKTENNIWYKLIPLKPKIYKYKYVVLNQKEEYQWFSDPVISEKDKDQNSIINFQKRYLKNKKRKIIPGRELKSLKMTKPIKNHNMIDIKRIYLNKIWVKPGEDAPVTVFIKNIKKRPANTELILNIKQFDGKILKQKKFKTIRNKIFYTIDTKSFKEGGYIIELKFKHKKRIINRKYKVLSIVKEIADDLRYGFYANWDKMGKDYDKKTDLLAQLHINAVEYYDYFPAHGYYAPKEESYEFEPFGTRILGKDVQKKIEAAEKRNILSIAYVAAYAASKSIYKQYPYPMTDVNGIPRIFNGAVMTESQVKKQNKEIWFYLMAIAKDSKWYSYIMKEFKRALDDSPDDLFSFHGFEIDSYGHANNDKYYSKGSRYNGTLLSKVIRELVADVQKFSHKIKDKAAVSFNCVNEFGIENMYDVTDFLFIENWSGFKEGLEDLVDICYKHRNPRNQRVILKIYPADTELGQKYWTQENLKYILGATMTGAGSVMIAGEPDEKNQKLHALNSLYYPDNVAVPEENVKIMQNYYLFDALLYGLSHGKNVNNLKSDFELPGCIIRTYDSDKKYIVIQILHNEDNFQWNKKNHLPKPLKNHEIAYKMPKNKIPVSVYYGSPDFKEFLIPHSIDWEYKQGFVRTLIPKLQVYGTLLIKYK